MACGGTLAARWQITAHSSIQRPAVRIRQHKQLTGVASGVQNTASIAACYTITSTEQAHETQKSCLGWQQQIQVLLSTH
jgi:hypothetical protein